MFLKDNKKINVEICTFFGRGTLAQQISALINVKIQGYYDDYYHYENLLELKDLPMLYAVGYKDLKSKARRLDKLTRIEKVNVCSFIADNSIVSEKTYIGNGVFINQGAIIDNFVELNDGVVANIGASISHHSKIGTSSFLGPQCTIAGNVDIGKCVFIGANSTVINDIKIGDNSIIAAGAVVTCDVPENVMVAGIPAVVKKILEKN